MKSFALLLGLFLMNDLQAQDTNCMIIGHRGFRGVYPENTLVGFQKALLLPIDGIELDVVVNKDHELVISHDPFFQKEFCLDSTGAKIMNEKEFNIYKLSQEEVMRFDCGSLKNPKFEEQQVISQYKPLWKEFKELKKLDSTHTILFEIKSIKADYGKSQPFPDEYAKLVVAELADYPFRSKIVIMSFDPVILNEIHKISNDYRMVLLTYKPINKIKYPLKKLDFLPYALGMFHPTIHRNVIDQLHDLGLKCFAWTVNDQKNADRLHELKVDALITDYPDRIK